MNTLQLLSMLLEKPKEELEYVLLVLMVKGSLDFVTLNSAYIKSLEYLKKDNLNKMIEAETCVLEALIDAENKIKPGNKHLQRWLYLLNKSDRFNMKTLNERFEYNEEEAKELSWYEKNKEVI